MFPALFLSISIVFIDYTCITSEGVDRGGGGTGIEGAESGVEGAESGVEGAGSGSRGAGRGDIVGGGLERLVGELLFLLEKS